MILFESDSNKDPIIIVLAVYDKLNIKVCPRYKYTTINTMMFNFINKIIYGKIILF